MRLDVAVIGSGPAGCSVAIRLRKAGVVAAIFTLPPRSGRGEIPETLPPGVCGTDLWPVSQASLRPHFAMASAWGSAGLTTRHSICNPLGHGWFVDRAAFDREMLAAATERGAGTVPVIYGRISSVSETRQGWRLQVDGHPTAEAAVVVDASGRSSAFARQIGVRRVVLDRLVCINARAIPADFPAGEALVESAEAGWWFSALTPRGELSVSWFTDWFTEPGRISFSEALRATIHTSKRVSRLLPGTLLSRTARTDRLEAPAGEGWFAAGDAAFASDPLGSQGILRALEAADRTATLILSDCARKPESILDYCRIHVDYVERFLRERQFFYGMEQRWSDIPFWKRRAVKATL